MPGPVVTNKGPCACCRSCCPTRLVMPPTLYATFGTPTGIGAGWPFDILAGLTVQFDFDPGLTLLAGGQTIYLAARVCGDRGGVCGRAGYAGQGFSALTYNPTEQRGLELVCVDPTGENGRRVLFLRGYLTSANQLDGECGPYCLPLYDLSIPGYRNAAFGDAIGSNVYGGLIDSDVVCDPFYAAGDVGVVTNDSLDFTYPVTVSEDPP
ncbi:MAG: hypothetical protein K2X82_08495 [Gemmataceae bacterium]|nr:hypothetical protein [Gemmataceae bacterium]